MLGFVGLHIEHDGPAGQGMHVLLEEFK